MIITCDEQTFSYIYNASQKWQHKIRNENIVCIQNAQEKWNTKEKLQQWMEAKVTDIAPKV